MEATEARSLQLTYSEYKKPSLSDCMPAFVRPRPRCGEEKLPVSLNRKPTDVEQETSLPLSYNTQFGPYRASSNIVEQHIGEASCQEPPPCSIFCTGSYSIDSRRPQILPIFESFQGMAPLETGAILLRVVAAPRSFSLPQAAPLEK